MKKLTQELSTLLVTTAILSLVSCTTSPESDTICGVVVERELQSSVEEDDAISVEIVAVPGEAEVSLRETSGTNAYLIRLHGLDRGLDDDRREEAIDVIRSLGPVARLYLADRDCGITAGTAEFLPGNLISLSGDSFAEVLLQLNLAVVDDSEQCSADLIRTCYNALLAQGEADNPTPTPTPIPTPTPVP